MTKKNFQRDPDISLAETLPGDVYFDPVWYERAMTKKLVRPCQFVGDAARTKPRGRVRPFKLLEGCLDEPLPLTVHEQGQAHCLSNVSDAEPLPA
jgi:choline monooxygenase